MNEGLAVAPPDLTMTVYDLFIRFFLVNPLINNIISIVIDIRYWESSIIL